MRRLDPGRVVGLSVLAFALTLALTGAAPKTAKKEPPPPKVDEVIANVALISGGEYRVEGIGLVVGLDNTGSDPPPGYYRERLLEDMRKAGVEDSEAILARKDTSLVVVKLTIPTGVTPEDRLDVEVSLPPGSGTTSLAGGHLIETRLAQVALAGGEIRSGNVLAKALGPIMIGTDARPGEPTVGRVLGGARVLREMPYNLIVKENRRSARTTYILQGVINARFFQSDGIDQRGLATAKTDQFLVLKVPKVYHHNQERYFRVVKLLPLISTEQLRGERTERWGKELLDPKTAGVAAMRLEGLGSSTIPTLQKGLESKDASVRFFAAEALAYLGDNSGVDALAETVVKQEQFRAFALAALVALDDSAGMLRLRNLLSEADTEVRYGAFNAIRTLDERDIYLGRLKLLDEEPTEEDESGSLAMQIKTPRKKQAAPQRDEPFSLYVVDCEGPPLVHLARSRRCEIVVFGRGQKLLTPIVLGQNNLLLNAADGDEQVEMTRIVANRLDVSDVKVTSPLELGEVIRSAANLGASYPELVAILQAADAQKNLPGPLVVDALPAPSPEYDDALLGLTPAKTDESVKKAAGETDAKKKGLLNRLFRRRSN